MSASTHDVITTYYTLANAGDWDAWCDLFAPDLVMDEQLAGRVEGQQTLRQMMAGFPQLYASFANVPEHVVVDGDTAAVISTLTATTPQGAEITARVANYFRLRDGQIAYLANFHDTAPFTAAGAS